MGNEDVPYIANGKEGKTSAQLQDGDIVIADTAEDETAGKVVEICNAQRKRIEAGLHTIPCRPINAYAPMYLGYYMNSAFYHSQLLSLLQGVKVLSISKANISKTVITSPQSKMEQEKISSVLYLIDLKVKKQRQVIDTLKKYKRGLISEILSQKLKVTHETEKWEEVSLSDVAEGFEYGMNAAATTFDGIHKYIRITDIDDESHKYIDAGPVSPFGVLEEKYRVRKNDILFARTGASVGKSYLYQETDGNLFFAGFLIRVHVKEGVDSGYVFLNTLTEEYDKWVLLESARSGQPGINAEQYRRYRFKLPSFKTQSYIAEIANYLDAKIHKESQRLLFLQKQKLGLLQQLFI